MNSCLIRDKNEVYLFLKQTCDESVKLGRVGGYNHAKAQIQEMITNIKQSPSPESQLNLLREAFTDFYGSSSAYGKFINNLISLSDVLSLFNDNYSDVLAQPTPPTREQAVTNRQLRQRRFLDSKFKNATNAKLYFKRSIANDLVETFLVSRSGDDPKYFHSQEDMNENVLKYKQVLLDRVFNYFDNNPLLKSKVAQLKRKMYDTSNGKYVYTGVIEEIKSVIDSELAPEIFEQGKGKRLDDVYKSYRDDDATTQKEAEAFLNAYNAWITLQNFDTVLVDAFDSIIKVHEYDINGHTVENLRKYEIKGKATNMWSTWLDSDDIADMADVISDVAQKLVETSRMYKWGSSEPYKDRYVSFDDYNCVLGFIKKQAFKPASGKLTLNSLKDIDKVSPYTMRIMLELLSMNRMNGLVETNLEGQYIPKAVTWKQLVSCISEKPHKYLPAIFDILCTTNILDLIQQAEGVEINTYVKNLIWSFNQEVFSANGKRSLFRLHTLAKEDSVYPILTQVAASTFPEDFLQYYENANGILGTRLLQDYAVDNVRRELLQDIQQTAITLSSTDYAKYGISYQSAKDPDYLHSLRVSLPIETGLAFELEAKANNVGMNSYSLEQYKKIWNNQKVQELIKTVLGIDFENDPDLKEAFVEDCQGIPNAVKNIGQLLGRVLFSSVVNNVYAVKHASNPKYLESFIESQYGKDKKLAYSKKVDRTTGYLPMIPSNLEVNLLKHLAQAKAINGNLLAAAQSITGEGTALANYSLSRLRNCFHNQIEMQCKKATSAVKDTTFVVNDNDLFEGIMSRREFKTLTTNQQSTEFSDKQSMQLAFISDYLGSLLPNDDNNSYLKNGRVSFLPTVNSDKPQIDGLLVNLYAESHIPNGVGGYKLYVELTDSEIEQEMRLEFNSVYTKVIENINNELYRVVNLLSISNETRALINSQTSVIERGDLLRKIINKTFGLDLSLGSDVKSRVINGLHKVITEYNNTHSRNPIMLAEHIHYTLNSSGITSNKVLDALYGRFNPNLSDFERNYLSELYSGEEDYISYLQRNSLLRNGVPDVTSSSAFFKYQEHSTVKDLLKMGFQIYLRGSDDVVRSDQPEIKFLKGEATFTADQLKDPRYRQLAALNVEMKNWISEDGLMIIAKGIVDGKLTNITTIEQLEKAQNLQVHPMLTKLNRLDYLCTQQYTLATVGSHYVHKGFADGPNQVIAEEAQRWLASNKRNVAATSTVHVFQNKQLNGVPSVYNLAIIEDFKSDLYNVMGDLYLGGHKPFDGGTIDNIWIAYLENNSLCGESVGDIKKPFGTFYDEKYAAGGIVKTAGFPPTNVNMRRSASWVSIQRNMSQRPWIKEHPDVDGRNIEEIVDITYSQYANQPIDYTQAIKGQPIMYKRVAHDNPSELAAYKLLNIKSLGNNNYEITEAEINSEGVETGVINQRIEHINNNWDLFMNVFGGYYSLEIGSDNKLTWSENSNLLMVHAINNVGYHKDTSHLRNELNYVQGATSEMLDSLDSVNTGLDQDDVWQPLKYSDIHCIPNIGAIKSSQFNVNPEGKDALDKKVDLNFFRMRMAQFGIQLDKEHHADMSEVSMPTQIIQALTNRSYTSDYAKEAYEALAILTNQAIEPYLKGINEIISSNGEDIGVLSEEITQLILDHLLKSEGEETSVNAILSDLLDKARDGKKITFAKDIKGKVPWSDPTIYNKLFSLISTTLTNVAVKMKFPGSLSVICPTEGFEKIHGEFTLNSFVPALDASGNTRTPIAELRLENYQKSVQSGNEVDSEGNNLLIFDSTRDTYTPPVQGDNETVEQYQRRIRRDAVRKKLSLVSGLKTQHNYIVEFSDGSSKKITINTPPDYFDVKNLILFGVRNPQAQNLETPFNYDEVYYRTLARLESEVDIYDTKEGIVASYLSSPVLLQASVKKETGLDTNDLKKLFGLFKSKEKGGVSIERLAEQIYGSYPDKFEDDYEVRNLIIDAIMSAQTTKDLKSFGRIALERMAYTETEVAQDQFAKYIFETYHMSMEEYEDYYAKQTSPVTVTKIYENVIDGRTLGAYNVRFIDGATNTRFQIYDLDSINLLFKLNNLIVNPKKSVKGYTLFTKLTPIEQQRILTSIFNSPLFDRNFVYNALQQIFPNLPVLDSNFVENVNQIYPNKLAEIVDSLHIILKPNIYRLMQKDLFKLSDNYKGRDRTVFVNGRPITPSDIKTEAYELIMPQVYKTVFGLQENDDLQTILRDPDFFIKRGLERFKCKLDHADYHYELKNFNGEHVYIFDKSEGVPEHLQKHIQPVITDTRKGKVYRLNTDDEVIYEMSSADDKVCKIGNTQIIITDNPMFYLDTLNYNTVKVSPKNLTKERYAALTEHLKQSKRLNHANYLKAITKPSGEYLSLKEFKELNVEIDNITIDNISYTPKTTDFKSITQICRLILQNGRELHTSFKESLNVIAGRIPAQSQQSFMTQRVVAFDSSGVNTAMVSTFQLFLQGSDLDIDAVTLLGYEFDRNGKFIAWSPYFDSTHEDTLKASKNIPLPTGQVSEVNVANNADNNFFDIYDKYFGTLFKYIPLPNGGIKTKDGVPELMMDIASPDGLNLLADFLRDFKKYGINIKGNLINGFVEFADDIESIKFNYNLTQKIELGGLGIRPDQLYNVAQQLMDFVNKHNNYINDAPSHLRMKMAKNYVVHYIYKVAAAPCNQTEAMVSVDVATRVLKTRANQYAQESGENTHAPGRVTSKIDMIGKGQAGKSGVGIGAVGIKANSTTQFYLSQIWEEGSDWDKNMLLFRRTYTINGKDYIGFANMYTSKEFSEEEREKFSRAMSLLNELESVDQVTLDVANNIASMLSIAVDNAKDLALAKINSGPRLMGMYVYGMTLGIPVNTLIDIMKSEEGMILAEMTEGSLFNRDTNAFKVLDVFSKLDGNIHHDLAKYAYAFKDSKGFTVTYTSPSIIIDGKNLKIRNTHDALFAAMYKKYNAWFAKNYTRLPMVNGKYPTAAKNFSTMAKHLVYAGAFDYIFDAQAQKDLDKYIEKTLVGNEAMKLNWIAAKNQMVSFIRDISKKSLKMKSSRGKELRILAEGAEEMRILGSILGINKGLKPTISEAETFIDTIENLIIDRKKILGLSDSDKDRIDFTRFMIDDDYQKKAIEAYEKVKHSVNILHLISRVPHFNGYLQTGLIPTTFYTNASVKYRTMRKYRLNIDSDPNHAPLSIFKYFNATSKKDKEAILKGLENAIQHQLLKGWLRTPISDSNPTLRSFKVPKGFEYFTDRNTLVTATEDTVISLTTEAGLASFKKYMEEIYIPSLQASPNFAKNTFVKNLHKISYDKTASHSTVTTYSLTGDLMSKKGRQAELNSRMTADFQSLATIAFQQDLGIPSAVDAFYLYAQYCYGGKKGKKSLMTLFDASTSKCSLMSSFNSYVADMDLNGDIALSQEDIITWCAPVGTNYSSLNWIYTTGQNEFGVSLKQKIQNVSLDEEAEAALQEARDNLDEEEYVPKAEKYGMYRKEYAASQYDRVTKNYFLVPADITIAREVIPMSITLFGTPGDIHIKTVNQKISGLQFSQKIHDVIQQQIDAGTVTKFKSVSEFRRDLLSKIALIDIPYKVSIASEVKKEVDLGILQTIIDQHLNC